MTESIFDGGDDGIAWPSYVDFLFAFSFILVLSLGYMAFVSVTRSYNIELSPI
jgi:hypothetical protein